MIRLTNIAASVAVVACDVGEHAGLGNSDRAADDLLLKLAVAQQQIDPLARQIQLFR